MVVVPPSSEYSIMAMPERASVAVMVTVTGSFDHTSAGDRVMVTAGAAVSMRTVLDAGVAGVAGDVDGGGGEVGDAVVGEFQSDLFGLVGVGGGRFREVLRDRGGAAVERILDRFDAGQPVVIRSDDHRDRLVRPGLGGESLDVDGGRHRVDPDDERSEPTLGVVGGDHMGARVVGGDDDADGGIRNIGTGVDSVEDVGTAGSRDSDVAVEPVVHQRSGFGGGRQCQRGDLTGGRLQEVLRLVVAHRHVAVVVDGLDDELDLRRRSDGVNGPTPGP